MQHPSDTARPRVSAVGLSAPRRQLTEPLPAQVARRQHRSAAGLTVPSKRAPERPSPTAARAPASPRRKAAELFDNLRALRDSLRGKVNLNDQAVALVSACILGGLRTELGIVRALVHLEFKRYHAMMTLERGTGRSPATSFWSKGDDGRYSLWSS